MRLNYYLARAPRTLTAPPRRRLENADAAKFLGMKHEYLRI